MTDTESLSRTYDYIITSQENDKIGISLEVAEVSELLQTMIGGADGVKDGDSSSSSLEDEDEILLPNVTTAVLERVVDFMKVHAKTPLPAIPNDALQSKDLSKVVPPWAAEIVNVHPEMVFKLFDAANYMRIPPLIDLLAAKVACQIKGHSKELDFHIPKRTEEEEKEIARKNPWLSDWPLA